MAGVKFYNAAQTFSTTLNIPEPTADSVLTLPSGSQQLAGTVSPVFTGTPTAPVPTVVNQLITMGNIVEKTGAVIGYGTGSGGTVTQATDKATSVTLNKPIGTINMNNAALAAGASVTFTVNNSIVDISSVIIINTNQNIVGAYSNYSVQSACIGIGNFIVNVKNISAGSLSEALQLNFAVIKGVTA